MSGVPTTLSGEVEVSVRSIAAARTGEEGPLLLVLHDIQREFGYVDAQWIPLIADELNLSRAEVHGVVSFYHDFRSKPAGTVTVRVCRAEACQSVGGHALAEHAQERLGIGFGQTTANGSATLDQVFCFGNCALGPTVEVGGMLYGRVDEERFDQLVEGATS
jgi:formate dehydrogenase subunit gamma